MRSIPQVWRQAYNAGNHNYVVVINMTLADGTVLNNITNDDIWEGGFSFEEGTSYDNSFSIGSAIIGKCTVILNNISEKFSGYDFFNAEFNAYLNLVGLSTQNLLIGHYTVDETSYNGSLITLTALNNMWRFDIPFSDINYTFTAYTTAQDVVNAMCQYSGIGITLATQQFQGYNFKISKPEQELNCREVLQYIAQATCNYCVINDLGNLELRWYDKAVINNIQDWDGGTFLTNTTPYSDGCDRDGGRWYWDGSTYVWTQGDEADGGYFYDNTSTIGYITDNHSIEVGTDGIVVTGIKICTSNQDNDDAYDYSWHDAELEQTHPRYTLVIQDNPFINKTNASERTTTIGAILANLPLRAFTATSVSDISIEAGDPVAINDFRGNRFYSFVTNVRFQTSNPESFSCGVESVTQNKVVRYSNEIKTLVEAQRNAQEMVSTYDQAVQRMNNLAVQAMGAYEDYEEVADARIYYLSNKPISKNAQGKCVFTNGSKVFKITGEGFFVSQDAGAHWTNGYDPQTGELVVNVLNAIGINAEWINAGKIDVNRLNIDGIMTAYNTSGTVTISGGKITASSVTGNQIANTTITGGKIATDTITASNIAANAITSSELNANAVTAEKINANAVTSDKINAGAVTAGKISVNNLAAISANMGTVNVGGNGNGNGVLYVNDASGNTKVTLDSLGIRAYYGEIGGWTIEQSGLTYGDDARVRPNRIACGNHGATLIGMSGKSDSGDNSGYLEVGINESSDYIHVHWNYISKNDSDGTKYAVFDDGSDERLKKDIEALSLEEALMIIKNTEALSFRYKENDSIKHYGFTAQRLEAECEKLGLENPFVRNGEMRGDLKNVSYTQFIAPLVKVVQNQQEEIDLLKQEVAELKARIK